MKPEQIQIVKLTFVQVMARKAEAGSQFYDRLFTIAPDTRPMFKGDIGEQARKLMDTLALAVGALRQGPMLAEMLQGLGRRHAIYGVRDEHYDKVGEALLWTLEKVLGDAFTTEARAAWTELYVTVATAMKKASMDRSAAPAVA